MTESEIIFLGIFIYEDRDISPKQLGVTSRQINYWIDHKVVPFVEKQQEVAEGSHTSKKTKWIRLNLVQAVWVSIIKELLSFGIPVENLAKLAEAVWNKPRIDKYADEVIHLNKKNSKLSKDNIKMLQGYLKDENLMRYLRTVINPFTDMIKSAVLRERLPHSMVYIPNTIEHAFLMNGNELLLKLGGAYLEYPLISIPIVPVIAKVLAIDFSNPKKGLSYLSEIERQIRDIVIFKKPKIVEIAFENEQIQPIVVTEQHKTREQLVRYILENKITKGSKLLIDIRSQGNYKLTLISK